MHDCIVKLLKNHDEESLECLCRLLSTIGKDLDFEKAKVMLNQCHTHTTPCTALLTGVQGGSCYRCLLERGGGAPGTHQQRGSGSVSLEHSLWDSQSCLAPRCLGPRHLQMQTSAIETGYVICIYAGLCMCAHICNNVNNNMFNKQTMFRHTAVHQSLFKCTFL